MNYNKITLNFSPEEEKLYRDRFFTDSVFILRIAFILGIILYGSFGLLDYKMFPEHVRLFHTIRYFVIVPLLFTVLVLSYTRVYRKVWQALSFICFIAMGVGITLMTAVEPENYAYYSGIMLVYTGGYFIMKLRFVLATLAGWILLLIFNIILIFYAQAPVIVMINTNFFFVSMNIMGMMAAYSSEVSLRRNYYLNMNLDFEKNLVLELNKNLEKTVEERTRELIEAKEKAEESDRLKTAFLHNMSHEIRTPMNAIMGFSDLLMWNINNKEKLERFVPIITQRCADLLVIIDDILDMAKIESNQLKINIENVKVVPLLKEIELVFNQQKTKLNKSDIDLSLTIPRKVSGLNILTDRSRLMQIFNNLLSNAFKYTLKGKVDFGFTLNPENHLVFYVSDTGIGIPKDKLDLIFERFIQLDPDNRHVMGGNGLGLSITKGLIHLLGGDIRVESEVNKGSTFYFTIKTISNIETPATPEELSAPDEDESIEGKTLLIVDDDEDNRALIKEILSKYGIKLLIAVNGMEAVSLCAKTPVDLVLMDIGLPDISGYEATRHILSHSPHTKIIAQTAYAGTGDKIKALESGCIDYISKPLKVKALLDMIRMHV